MATVVENVVIDFSVDYSELDGAIAELEKTGKLDASIGKTFSKTSQGINTATKDVKGLISEFNKTARTAVSMGKSVEAAFGAGIQDALDEAGVSAEEFAAGLKEANAPAKTLKAELRELKEALAQAKVNGTDVGKTFEDMRARAGALADAIDDANSEIKNVASDTRGIDNIVGSISALAGGFSAVQGAAALFGDENEDLQKALLKVNGAMALATGLQQIQIAVQKEGSLTKLADATATGIQTATQRLYTLATGQATAATVAFKIALAATGIGLFVVAIVALVSALNDTEASLEDVNKLLEQQNFILESNTKLIDRQTERRLLLAKEAGKAESDLIRIRSAGIGQQFDEITRVNQRLAAQRDALDNTSEGYANLNKQIQENKDRQDELNEELRTNNVLGRMSIKAESEERQKAIEDNYKKSKDLRDKAAAEARAQRQSDLQDIIAGIEKQLLFTEKASQEELQLKKDLVIAKRNLDLNAEKLTSAQAKLIRARAYKDLLDLQENFNKQLTEQQLQAQVDTNSALLAGITKTYEERLNLQIDNIATTAQLEINAAEGNAEKIILIEAKKFEAIRNLKNQFIDDELARQTESTARTNGIIKAGLLKLVADVQQSAAARIEASGGIAKQELAAADAAIAANVKKEQSAEDYYRKNQELLGKREDALQAHADRVIEIDKSEKEQLKQQAIELANLSIDLIGQAADFAAALGQLQSDIEQQRIEKKKQELDALIEAGAITEKQAKIRAQQLEILEKQARQKQAEREKRAAVFNAILAIPQAALKGLVQGGPVLAAIYGALAAAQAALVIARPVPKFFRGKKDKYEGAGIVGDMGAELVERDGRMFLYTKPTQTYLSANDKVYTAAETKNIMHNSSIKPTLSGSTAGIQFDYDKFAKAIPHSSFNVNIDKDFIEESVAKGLTRHFNNRYKFN